MHSLSNQNPRRAYWEKGEVIGPPFQHVNHFEYKPLENSKPDLGLALGGASIDSAPDMNDTFEEFGNSFNCWITIKVHYEPDNLNDETHN